MLSQRRWLVKGRFQFGPSLLRTLRLGVHYRCARLSQTSEAYPKRPEFGDMMEISSDRAQTTAEYGIIFALVLAAVIVTMLALGGVVAQLWTSVTTAWPA